MDIKKVVDTDGMAVAFLVTPKTVRKNHSADGHCYGIIPIKVGNKLLWHLDDIAKVLNGEILKPKIAPLTATAVKSKSPKPLLTTKLYPAKDQLLLKG